MVYAPPKCCRCEHFISITAKEFTPEQMEERGRKKWSKKKKKDPKTGEITEYDVFSSVVPQLMYSNHVYKCRAYPKGIPLKILFWELEHNKVLPDQTGDYVFRCKESLHSQDNCLNR